MVPSSSRSFVTTQGAQLVDGFGQPLTLRGVNLGGWLNMENFVTGHPANESLMRDAVRRAIGDDKYQRYFTSFLDNFFTDDDAQFLAETGINSVRIAVNYRHFEDDMNPFVLQGDGIAQLDRVVGICARHGIYAILDMHAVPGSQNHHWHSDNQTHRALFWQYVHFQDRAVWLWEQLADHYRDNVWVAGYNLLNEPADESREVVGPFYARLIMAIRAIDPHHTLFVDGNTYATEFDIFGDPTENTVYTCHDYAAASLARYGEYPGYTEGAWYDKGTLEAKFLSRTEYSRRTGTPLYVGEFGPIYTGDPARDAQLYQVLDDQLSIYREHGAGWCIWMYKDVGRQGLTAAGPQTPYRTRFASFIAKKERLATDAWGPDYSSVAHLLDPVQDFVKAEFPDFDGYPWGTPDWVRTLMPHILFAQPLVGQYADLFRGLDDSELRALAESFALRNCVVREPLRARLAAQAATDTPRLTPCQARSETQ